MLDQLKSDLLNKNMIYLISILLILITFDSNLMVNASEEFPVYRMQQFDLLGNRYGSRSTVVNFEARTLNSKSFTRKSVLIKLNELTIEKYRSLVQQSVGAIIIAIPFSYDQIDNENLKFLETSLLKEEIKIPIYFVLETPELKKYFDYIDSEKTNDYESAFQALINSIATNGFQFVVNSQQSQSINDFQGVNLQGKLMGHNNEAKSKKTILISAHYDALGLATSLSYGCDSNGSGVVALLELSRLLSYLYANIKTVPGYNLVFLLTAAGKFNYFGTKKWLDEQFDSNDLFSKVELEDIAYAISLDSIGNGNELYMHVSKPPKENQPAFDFLNLLEKNSAKYGLKFQLNHKKINLANEIMAWEHERFSLNKVQAFTLSHFASHKDNERLSMVDTRDNVNETTLVRNIKVIAESLGQFLYNINDDVELFTNDMEVSNEFISSSLNYICSIPRSASLLHKNHPLINTLHSHFSYYLKDPVKYIIKATAKEPEFVFYNEEQSNLVIYNVKPAIFDLFLAILIGLYLFLVYLFVSNFNVINNFLISLTINKNKQKPKTN